MAGMASSHGGHASWVGKTGCGPHVSVWVTYAYECARLGAKEN